MTLPENTKGDSGNQKELLILGLVILLAGSIVSLPAVFFSYFQRILN